MTSEFKSFDQIKRINTTDLFLYKFVKLWKMQTLLISVLSLSSCTSLTAFETS